VPFFKTFGELLRTQICDVLDRFSLQTQLMGSRVLTRASFGSFQPILRCGKIRPFPGALNRFRAES